MAYVTTAFRSVLNGTNSQKQSDKTGTTAVHCGRRRRRRRRYIAHIYIASGINCFAIGCGQFAGIAADAVRTVNSVIGTNARRRCRNGGKRTFAPGAVITSRCGRRYHLSTRKRILCTDWGRKSIETTSKPETNGEIW